MEGPSSAREPPAAPRRPLAAAAVAALAGAWLGSRLGPELPGLVRALAGAGILATLAALLLEGPAKRASAALLPGGRSGDLLRRDPEQLGALGARRGQSSGALPWSALLLIVALAALRASEEVPPTASAGPATGRYWPEGRFGGVERGRLEGGPRLSLSQNLVRPGEWVRVDPAALPSSPARGPLRRGHDPPPILELAPDEVQRLAPPPAEGWGRARAAWIELRARAVTRVESGIGDRRTRGLVAAMLLGERGGLDPEQSDLFTRTGTRHLLAISGLHVGLVALLIATPLGLLLAALARRLARAPAWARVPGPWIVLVLAPLVPLSGAGAPVARAFVALALFAFTRCLPPTAAGEVRRADPLSLLSLAALLECCARPGAAASISLQLSYAATLGLILTVGPLSRGLARCLPGAGRLPVVTRLGRPLPGWLRVPAQRLLDGTRLALAVSLAASLATLPLIWSSFGELGLAGVLVTPLAIPPLASFLASGWAWLSWPCAPLEALLGFLGRSLEGLLGLADRLPGTPLPLPPRPRVLLLLATAGALAVAAGRAPRPALRASALLWGLLLLPWRPAPAGLELYLLDVGHGTSAVLRVPGCLPIVFDAGSRDRRGVARGALAPLLASFEVREAIYALSHQDRDHSAALPWILERFPPRLWLGARTPQIEAGLAHAVPRIDPDVGRVELRLAARAAQPLVIELLRGLEGEDNQGSRSLLIHWDGHRILLSGDADDRGVVRQLREGWLAGPLRLLLLPHHGSESRFLFPLLDQTAPEEVWLSASGAAPVEPELVRRGLLWRSTAHEGPLELRIGPRSDRDLEGG